MADPDTPISTAVVTSGLVLSHGSLVAVRDADLAIPAGRLTAVIGPNGSGKSTLLRAMSGLHQPSAGEVNTLGASPRRRRSRIAHVLQTTVVNDAVPITAREVVRMGRYPLRSRRRLTPADHEAVQRALERMDVVDLAGRHLTELSGGQRQRVLIAQGLAQEADLLLLDEPTTGLDVVAIDRVEQTIAEETAAGRTVVMTTHDIHSALRADHVVLIATEVIASGPPQDVLTHEHLETAYGGHLHELPGGGLVLDDPTPHRH